jgi:hypothetical protein
MNGVLWSMPMYRCYYASPAGGEHMCRAAIKMRHACARAHRRFTNHKLQKASLVPQEYSWITWAKAAKDLLRICLVSP